MREAFTFTVSGGGTGTDLLERKLTAHVKIPQDGAIFATAAPLQGIKPSKTIAHTHALNAQTDTITCSPTYNGKRIQQKVEIP